MAGFYRVNAVKVNHSDFFLIMPKGWLLGVFASSEIVIDVHISIFFRLGSSKRLVNYRPYGRSSFFDAAQEQTLMDCVLVSRDLGYLVLRDRY